VGLEVPPVGFARSVSKSCEETMETPPVLAAFKLLAKLRGTRGNGSWAARSARLTTPETSGGVGGSPRRVVSLDHFVGDDDNIIFFKVNRLVLDLSLDGEGAHESEEAEEFAGNHGGRSDDAGRRGR